MSVEKPVQLGLCCMNTTLKKQKVPVYASRRMIVKTIEKLGIEELKREYKRMMELKKIRDQRDMVATGGRVGFNDGGYTFEQFLK